MNAWVKAAHSLIVETFANEGSGHDIHHIERVWRLARRIGEEEGADLLVVDLAALLHDIADWKFHGGDLTVGPAKAREFMVQQGVPVTINNTVCDIIARLSYKGAGVKDEMPSLEGRVVQDADRLDAIGAIGIARCFAFGGHCGQPLYDPAISPTMHQSAGEYVKSRTHSLNHFYEKLFLLKDRFHTRTAKRMAAKRHAYMETYVKQFLAEWDGNA